MTTPNVLCGPCGYKNINRNAHKWCTICDEGFCEDCMEMHKAQKLSRDHKLIDIEDYRKITGISVIQTCGDHKKTLDSYCKTHDKALCFSCVLSQHKSCVDVIPLVDAARNAKTSTVLVDLEETISVGLKNIKCIIDNISPAYLDKQEKDIKKEITEYRFRVNKHLDDMEKNLIAQLESKLAYYRSKHDTVLKDLKQTEKVMNKLKEQTHHMKTLASDLHIFLGTRQINTEVHECVKSTSKNNVIDKYNANIEIDPVLSSLLTDMKIFGKINTKVTKTEIPLLQPKIHQAQTHVHPKTKDISEFKIKLKQTFKIKRECKNMWISGCTILPNGQLLIADFWGKNQLIQYNQNGAHVRDIPVSRNPYDVTVIDSDRVAVSYGKLGYIEILNIQHTTVEKKVNLDNSTWGLSYQGGKIYVVVEGRAIIIIELSGKILNTINITVGSVDYVTTTTDRIYYSESRRNTVTCCDMSGYQIWEFQDRSVKYPYGLTVDNNQNVIVVGFGSHNVTIISRDGQTSKTLITKSDGLLCPEAIDFNKNTGDLFVCNREDSKAFLFRVVPQ